MVGALCFLSILLIGLTSAQCPTPCSPCKVFNDDTMCGPHDEQFDCGGTWNLQEPNPNPKCTRIINGEQVNVCLYRREGDDKEFCFSDPGDLKYELCTTKGEMCWTDCYNFTGVQGVKWYNLPNNDAASCSKFCKDQKIIPPNKFFVLHGTDCGCLSTPPLPEWKVDKDNCDVNCTGRIKTKCGGKDGFNLNGGATNPEQPNGTCPCYNNTNPITSKFSQIYSKTYLPHNDKDTCNKFCVLNHPHFEYFGLGSDKANKGYECYCVTLREDLKLSRWIDLKVSPYYCCGSPCPGNNTQECGYYQNWNNQSYINVCPRL